MKFVKEKSSLTNELNDDADQTNLNFSSSSATTPSIALDDTDRKLLQLVQDDFPIVERPWHKISSLLSVSEDEILLRIKRLSEAGIIRKIGAIVDSSKMGLTAATLIAMQVPKSKVEAVSQIINEYANVSHNYERDHEYNVWFTIAASTMQEVENILTEILQKTGCKASSVLNLPTIQRFKVNVRFQLT